MNAGHNFLVAAGLAAGLAFAGTSFAKATAPESFTATSLDEYAQMDSEEQLALIL